ncbi:hypothetical protein MNBD_NITROSPINAE01-1670 [hydrothermal vent metagenome]|uniref:Uncharacterized protein n=1 Tax=hydrothermal vent metagenome TaxID=652676 RepID=A0A3B1C999_9ZZZZ
MAIDYEYIKTIMCEVPPWLKQARRRLRRDANSRLGYYIKQITPVMR